MLYFPPKEMVPKYGYCHYGKEVYFRVIGEKHNEEYFLSSHESEPDAFMEVVRKRHSVEWIPYEQAYGVSHPQALKEYEEGIVQEYKEGWS